MTNRGYDTRFWVILLSAGVALALLFYVIDVPFWFRVIVYTVAGVAVAVLA